MSKEEGVNQMVIVIDDQKGFHGSFALLAKLIKIKEYKMYTTAEDMLQDLNGEASPLVFVDWNLVGSKRTKGDLIKHLRERKPLADIYVISSTDEATDQEIAKQNGANGWILKTNLIKSLKEFFEKRHENKQFKIWK